jgi:NADPH-dependent glutamate synthase beta subunit-like oxidoreductase
VEIDAAEHEGAKFVFLAAPARVIGNEDGHVTHLEYLKMELGEPDASGRRRPVPVEGSETTIAVDMVISAIGQGPDLSFKDEGKRIGDIKTTRRDTIECINPVALQTSIPYIFTGGDAATGAALVVEAIGGGRRAAISIHNYLAGEKVSVPPSTLFKSHIPVSIFDSVVGIVPTPRTKMPELEVEDRIKTFDETDLVISEADAIREANRCLNCCRICYNKDAA